MNSLFPQLPVKVTCGFVSLLHKNQCSIAATLVPGRLIFISADDNGGLAITDTLLDAPWGIATGSDYLAVSTRRDITRYANNGRLAQHCPGATYDAYFAPRLAHSTGNCQIHDLWAEGDTLYAVNTRFSVICRFDAAYSFTPVWRPPFITEVMPEDRCHLNGMAWENGRLTYATAFGEFNVNRGWRNHPPCHGILMDCAVNEILTRGLCLPHSQRVIDGQLYLTEMGKGHLLRVDRKSGEVNVLQALPGFARGIAKIGECALVGLSLPRESFTGWDLPVKTSVERCIAGIAAVDLASGQLMGMLEFAGGVEEVSDLQVLRGVRSPGVLDLSRWDGLYPIDTPDAGFWMKQGHNE